MIAGALILALAMSAPDGQRPAKAPEAVAAERDAALSRAESALKGGRRDEAKKLLADTAERLGSVTALLRLARLQSGEGDTAAALQTLARARTIAPNSEEVLSAIGQVSLSSRAPVAAIQALEPLARICPAVAQYHYLLGVAFMQAGDMPAATESLREAERLEPARHMTLLALGMTLNNRKLFGEAKLPLARSLELEPDDVESLAALAEAEEGLGDLEAAHNHAMRALSRVPAHPTGNLVAGLVLMKRERYEEARAAFERAAAAEPDSPKAFYQLSLACARLGDSAASARNLELYRRKLRALEARVEQLRNAGIGTRGGMQP